MDRSPWGFEPVRMSGRSGRVLRVRSYVGSPPGSTRHSPPPKSVQQRIQRRRTALYAIGDHSPTPDGAVSQPAGPGLESLAAHSSDDQRVHDSDHERAVVIQGWVRSRVGSMPAQPPPARHKRSPCRQPSLAFRCQVSLSPHAPNHTLLNKPRSTMTIPLRPTAQCHRGRGGRLLRSVDRGAHRQIRAVSLPRGRPASSSGWREDCGRGSVVVPLPCPHVFTCALNRS